MGIQIGNDLLWSVGFITSHFYSDCMYAIIILPTQVLCDVNDVQSKQASDQSTGRPVQNVEKMTANEFPNRDQIEMICKIRTNDDNGNGNGNESRPAHR